MIQPFSIDNLGTEIHLIEGYYDLFILGGFGVTLNGFQVLFSKSDEDLIIKPENTFWKTQSYELGKRAKRIATFEVFKSGIYKVRFVNATKLKVERPNWLIFPFFQKSIPIEEIQVALSKKL